MELWSTYTCLLAYKIGTAFGEFPLASVVISGFVTTVIIAIVFVVLRRGRGTPTAAKGPASQADREPRVGERPRASLRVSR